MPDRLLARRFKLGTFAGIGLYVHWTFALVIAFVAITARESGPLAMAYAVCQLLGVFFCVTLHEYGHAMAARCFGIGTADITLLPIGGVARLRRMPRIPWQELVVAVAGPAVNVVIVTLLILSGMTLLDTATYDAIANYFHSLFTAAAMEEAEYMRMMDLLSEPSWVGFGVLMLIVNTMLVVFNMIPAFPMDGGRVFRSLMAMIMDYRRATTIASRVGLACAAMMAFAAITYNPGNPIPVLIAAFIGYAGIAEARQVDVMEQVRGLTAGQVMVRTQRAVLMDTPVSEIMHSWQHISFPAIPVVSITGSVVGMIFLEDLARSLARGIDPHTTAGQMVNHDRSVGTIGQHEELESALLRTGRHSRQIPIVDGYGHLVGILDLDSMLARSQLSRRQSPADRAQTGDAQTGDAPLGGTMGERRWHGHGPGGNFDQFS